MSAPPDLRTDFPTDEEAALQEKILRLVAAVQDIQTQLSNRDRRYPEGHAFAGRRLTDRDYQAWRYKATSALRHSLAALRGAKAELKARATARRAALSEAATQYVAGQAGDVLESLFAMVMRAILDFGFRPKPEEQILLDAIREMRKSEASQT